LIEYFKLAQQAKSRLESFTERSWVIPTPEDYAGWLKSNRRLIIPRDGIEYFIYLTKTSWLPIATTRLDCFTICSRLLRNA
jgi:hypothetical protein